MGGITPLGAILRGIGMKIPKWDCGGKTTQKGKNAQPLIDH